MQISPRIWFGSTKRWAAGGIDWIAEETKGGKAEMTAENEIQKVLGVTPGKNSWEKRLYWIVPLILIVGVVGLLMVHLKSVAAKRADHYRTENTQISDLTVTVTATGQLKPTRTVDVGSQVSGIMDKVFVNYNDQVKRGQVLAKINTEKLDAQVLQDKAALEAAQAKVDDAKVTVTQDEAQYKRDLDARQRSKKYQIVSQQDLDSDKAAYDRAVVAVKTARASVIQAEDNLKIDETNVEWATITAPVDGVVLSRSVEPGQTIAASFQVATLFEIAEDLRMMTLDVNIDEADVGKVRAGQSVFFTVDAYPGRHFPGTITRVQYTSTTTNNVVTYLAEIAVRNDDLALRPGMTATATITVQSLENVLLVPNHALRFLPSTSSASESSGGLLSAPKSASTKANSESTAALNNPRVWVLRNGKPVPIPVVVGATDGKYTEIKSGALAPGTPLIVETVKETK
jgi:HlyD family secretion protein